MTDSRGKEIRTGQRVAFNQSGDVVAGRVVAVSLKHIKIECERGGGSYTPWGHISRVRNGRSILILEPWLTSP